MASPATATTPQDTTTWVGAGDSEPGQRATWVLLR